MRPETMMRPHAKLLAARLPLEVVAVLVTAIVVVVVVHHGKTRVMGCVSGTAGGLTIVSERDQRVYELSGAAAGLKAGERVTIDGKTPPEWLLLVA